MNKVLIVLGTWVFSLSILHAQKDHKLVNLDCGDSYLLSDSIFGPFHSLKGAGEIMEISNFYDDSSKFFKEEVNSSWYHFIVPYKTDVTLDINPIDGEVDFDFLLFKPDDEFGCEKILKRELQPIRSNAAFNSNDNHGKTGISIDANQTHVPRGPGDNYSSVVKAEGGDEFILVINSSKLSDEMGHFVYLKYDEGKEERTFEGDDFVKSSIEKKTKILKKKDSGISLTVDVKDSKLGNPVNVTLEVDGIVPGKPLIVENKNHFTYILEKRKKYQVRCIYHGYMFYSEEVIAPSKAEKMELDIVLQPIEEGSKLTLENIKFKPDGAHILRSSEPELMTLLKFIDKNPSIVVQINGHVNAPNMKNTSDAQRMSKARAKAVYHYLISHGASKHRIRYKGFGNTQMIYAHPKTYEEERANRRVEIEILKK